MEYYNGDIYDNAKKLFWKYENFDFVYIYHYKDLYLNHLKFLEDSTLLANGATVVADNIITKKVKDYL